MKNTFCPRDFLRQRQALLVHFSTVMARDPELLFPRDLLKAAGLKDVALSFSTILRGDTNPHGDGRGGAEGSVGILVDIGPDTVIETVWHEDAGGSEFGGFGDPPSELSCAASIDRRQTSNEWRVRNYVPVGIVVLPPIVVRKKFEVMGGPTVDEVGIDLNEAIQAFGSWRILGASAEKFHEFNRAEGSWRSVTYDEIIPAPAQPAV